jgi:hypothetical protein
MTENIITWNATNWITVVLMAVIGFAVLSTVAQFVHARKQGG